MRHGWFSRKAFTLIELMVVVTIIAILAALIVPALQRAQAKAMTANCMAKAKAIAGSVRTYASSWDGYTNPDSEYYVALMGYKNDDPATLNTGWATTGYFGEPPGWASSSTTASYKYAQSEIKAFRCPVDDAPTTTKHAVKTSYKVMSAFAGGCVMALTTEANTTLMVREIGKRHPVGLSST